MVLGEKPLAREPRTPEVPPAGVLTAAVKTPASTSEPQAAQAEPAWPAGPAWQAWQVAAAAGAPPPVAPCHRSEPLEVEAGVVRSAG